MSSLPALTEHRRQPHRLAGRWVGEERLAATPWAAAGIAEAQVETRVGLGVFFVTQDCRQLRESRERLSAHAPLTRNAEADCVTMFWFDSLGYMPETPATGDWQGGTLTLTRSSRRGVARHAYEWIGDREYRVRLGTSRPAMPAGCRRRARSCGAPEAACSSAAPYLSLSCHSGVGRNPVLLFSPLVRCIQRSGRQGASNDGAARRLDSGRRRPLSQVSQTRLLYFIY